MQLNKESISEQKKFILNFKDIIDFDYIYTDLKQLDSSNNTICKQIITHLQKEPLDVVKFIKDANYMKVVKVIPTLRPLIWRLLIRYFRDQRKFWAGDLELNKKNYTKLIDDAIVTKKKNSSFDQAQEENKAAQQQSQRLLQQQAQQQQQQKQQNQLQTQQPLKNVQFKQCVDHPLNRSRNSSWNTHFKDIQLWETIEKDTKRTRIKEFFGQKIAKNHFEQEDQNMASIYSSILSNTRNCEYYYDILSRILYLYAKLNPAVGYIQGMNEIVATIYYCFINDQSTLLSYYAESDAFFCFTILMTELKENFCQSKEFEILNLERENAIDNSAIKKKVSEFDILFKKVDQKLWLHLQKLQIDTKLFIIRWLIVSLTQEFKIDQALRIWDALLISQDKINFINYICVSILYTLREELVKMDYSQIIIRLQNIQNIDIDEVIEISQKLYVQYNQCK